MNKFRAGDIVLCVRADRDQRLQKWALYRVRHTRGTRSHVELGGAQRGLWFSRRFVLIDAVPR